MALRGCPASLRGSIEATPLTVETGHDTLAKPAFKRGSPKVNFPLKPVIFKVEIVSCDAFESIYPLQHSGLELLLAIGAIAPIARGFDRI